MSHPPVAPLPDLRLSVQFAEAAHRALLPRSLLLRWVRAALRVGPCLAEPGTRLRGLLEPHQITLRLVGEQEGRALNQAYRGKDYATNVLTFVYDDVPAPLTGDFVLCAPVVAREALEQHKDLKAHYAHLVVHATLHLHGYDHEDAREAEEMEKMETALMAKLRYPDPYAVLK